MSRRNPYLPPEIDEPGGDDYVSMDVEADYEGGQWIDGEFFYEKDQTKQQQRRQKHLTKQQQIYGVLGGDDDDDENDDEEKKTRRNRRNHLIHDGDEDDEDVEEEEQMSPRGLGSIPSSSKTLSSRRRSDRSSSPLLSSDSILNRSMKFVSASSSPTETKQEDENKSTVTTSVDYSSSSSHTAISSNLSSSTAAVPPVSIGFKRRRLEAREQIERQKRSDDEEEEESTISHKPQHGHGSNHRLNNNNYYNGKNRPSLSSSPSTSSSSSAPTMIRPVQLDADFGSFTKHSSGVAMKLLEKMGFKGRLGKNETGIANPILTTIRPKNAGLGVINEHKGKTKVARNAVEEEKIAAEEVKITAEKKKTSTSPSVTQTIKSWKRGNPPVKKVYKTAAQVLNENNPIAGQAAPVVIIDMTSGVPIQKSASQLNQPSLSTVSISSTSSPSAIPELQHNVQLLVDLTEAKIQDIDYQIKQTASDMAALTIEEQKQRRTIEKHAAAKKKLQLVLDDIDQTQKRLHEISQQHGNDLKLRLSVMDDLMTQMMKSHRSEYQRYSLIMQMSVAIVLPMLKALLHGWEPFEIDANADIYAVLHKWKVWLDGDNDQTYSSISSSPSLSSAASSVLYHEICESLLIPKLRLTLSHPSLPLRHAAPIVSLCLSIEPLLSTSLYNQLTSSSIFPRLKRSLEEWNPRTDEIRVDSWILPYTHIIPPSQMQELYTIIRSKLTTVLSSWKAEDMTAVSIIAPWLTIWSSNDMEAFLQRSITPKLINALAKLHMSIPQQPDEMKTIKAVLSWYPIYATTTFLPLLLTHLFPSWFSALQKALTQNTNIIDADHAVNTDTKDDVEKDIDYGSISEWYLSWKSLLGSAINESPVIKECWKRGLDLINCVIEQRDEQQQMRSIRTWIQQIKQTSRNTTNTEINPKTTITRTTTSTSALPISSSAFSTASSIRYPVAAPPPPISSSSSSSNDNGVLLHRESLSQYAALHGLSVFPHPRHHISPSGQSIYMFGEINIYWTAQNVFAWIEETKEWKMVSLSELLYMAENR